jgi:hypothetical protein
VIYSSYSRIFQPEPRLFQRQLDQLKNLAQKNLKVVAQVPANLNQILLEQSRKPPLLIFQLLMPLKHILMQPRCNSNSQIKPSGTKIPPRLLTGTENHRTPSLTLKSSFLRVIATLNQLVSTWSRRLNGKGFTPSCRQSLWRRSATTFRNLTHSIE